MTSVAIAPISKTFKLHPAIIYSVIREQAGDPVKALTELVMNSVDAGANKITITLDAENFSIQDNGEGFGNAESIENFFGTFGTPHEQGDATYGKFRIGRGQIFSLSTSYWRSGMHGMFVDLGNHKKTDDHGYSLSDYNEEYTGCLIKGEFYQPLNIHEQIQNIKIFNEIFEKKLSELSDEAPFDFSVFSQYDFFSRLMRSISFIEAEITINGKIITGVRKINPIYENEDARFYAQNKTGLEADIFLNQGVFICEGNSWTPMVIDFKKSPNLNLARNEINSNCPIYKRVTNKKHELIFQAYMNNEKWASSLINSLLSYIETECMELNPNLDSRSIRDQVILKKNVTKDNFKSVINKIKVKQYKAGKISDIRLYDAIVEINKNPSEYLVSDRSQNWIFLRNSKQVMQNYLRTTGCMKTIIFDEHRLIQTPLLKDEGFIDSGFEIFDTFILFLNNMLDTEFSIELFPHELISSGVSYSKYKIKKADDVVDVVDFNVNETPRNKAIKYFEGRDLITIYDKTSVIEKIIKTELVITNFINNLAKIFKDDYEDNSETINSNWLISTDKKINVLIVLDSTDLVDSYNNESYIFINYKYLMQYGPLHIIFRVLFNGFNQSLTPDIFDLEKSFLLRNEIREEIYNDYEFNKALHDNLDTIFQNKKIVEFIDSFLNQYSQSWENGYKKLSAGESKIAKETLSVIALMPTEFQKELSNYETVKKINFN